MQLVELTQEEQKILKKLELDILLAVDNICRKHNIVYWLGYGTLLGSVRHQGFIPWDDDMDICIPRKDYNKFRNICMSELPEFYFYQSHRTDKNYYYLFDKIRIKGTVFKESCMANSDINHGVYIDIFPIDYLPGDIINGNIQYYMVRIIRAIINSRFLDLKTRKGIKRVIATIIRFVFSHTSMDKLWEQAEKIASKHSNDKQFKMGCFMSPYGKKDFFESDLLKKLIEMEFEGYKFYVPKEYDKILSRIYGDYMTLPPVDKRKTIHDLIEISIYNT